MVGHTEKGSRYFLGLKGVFEMVRTFCLYIFRKPLMLAEEVRL